MTQEELQFLLSYDPSTGLFIWLRGRRIGRFAGTLHCAGYNQINIKGKLYLGHRLAWLYMTGKWPKEQIDHINQIRSDDSWDNLREATHSQNKMNTAVLTNNQLGVKGVQRDRGRFVAKIKKDRVSYYLGSFGTVEEAKKVYNDAAAELHGEFMCA